ncbi:MAG: RNA polymerase sigma factor [Anaerolineae bacterium]|nr:RNA polymerase sigma factor [Candidatus Roseilinea sp.]MDW8450732.1 RNA polymerase sigma factor [Anaerolineae bacterium]
MRDDNSSRNTQRAVELALIERVVANDQSAITQLFYEYEPAVSRYIVHTVPDINEQDLQDVVQETFIGVLRSAKDYRGDSSLSTWILRIAHYKAIDALRRRRVMNKREETIENMSSDEVSFVGDASADVEEDVVSEQDIMLVRRALAMLPPDQRQALTLRYVNGLRVDDVAATMRITRRRAELLITRGRAELRRRLTEMDVRS